MTIRLKGGDVTTRHPWSFGQFATQRNCRFWGSGGGSVGRAVTSDTRGPRFESSHWQTFISNICLLLTVNCNEKTKIKKPRCAESTFDYIWFVKLTDVPITYITLAKHVIDSK